ncbi:hypothetical protein HZA98_02550 [Candidatus Woesearchaeota archaeon]|nr:hypothetical protein [Candidatus Woesearchaeota archaeon]
MRKWGEEFWIFSFVLFSLFGFVFLVSFGSLSWIGFATSNVSLGIINAAPIASTIPNQTLAVNSSVLLNLTSYFTDPEGATLVFNGTSNAPNNITINISSSAANVSTSVGYAQNFTVYFNATDYVNTVSSNVINFTINISSTSTSTSTSTAASSAAASVSEGKKEKEKKLAPSYAPEKSFYLQDAFVKGAVVYSSVVQGNIFYFGSEQGIVQGSLFVREINKTENFIVLDYNTSDGNVIQYTLHKGNTQVFDVNHDGLDDYVLLLQGYSGDASAEFEFKEVGKSSFVLFQKYVVPLYWKWLSIPFLFLILSFWFYCFFVLRSSASSKA